jgi:hypothetical protein
VPTGSGGSSSPGTTAATVSSSGGTPIETGGLANSGGQPGSGGKGAGGTPPTAGVPSSGGVPTPTGGKPPTPTGPGHYQMENLDRGVVAVKVSGGVYVGWRMFGYEYDTTATNVSYNLYKDGTKLAGVTDSTNYLDAAGTASSKYSVSAVIKTVEGPQSTPVGVWAQQYLSIPITPPPNGTLGGTYSANDASPGDLDGDGQLDIVLKWDPSNSQDSSFSNKSDTCIIDGYKMDGTKLWRIDVGMNIRAGAHDTQLSVFDFDGDGKAELGIKTAPGTKDGTGAFLKKGPAAGADNTKDYRGPRGMALGGPEWFTVFDGKTGAELDTMEYPVLYGSVTNWGDSNGNRSHRFNGGFAFVKDGGTANGLPSIITERGYYTRMTISALTFRGGVLAKNWVYDSVTAIPNGGGDHSCMAADVDGDGAQEIIPGAYTINSDGTFKASSGMGHGDALHVSELVVGKGISVFSVHESLGGMDCHDGATGKTYFTITSPGTDTGRGVAEYVNASDTTAATCSGMGNVNCGTGASSSGSAGSNFLIYWNADVPRSTMNGTTLPGTSTSGTSSCNGTKSTPTLTADLLGDWREEAVLRETSNTALRVYTTTNVSKRRIYTLMHDPTYRAQANFEQSSYNQPPHVGFHVGPGMADPPKPDIFVK